LKEWKSKPTVAGKNRIVFVTPQILSTDHGGGIRVIEEARALAIYGNSTISIFTYNTGKRFDGLLPASVSVNRTWFTPNVFSAGPTLHRIYMDAQLALKAISSIPFTPHIIHVHAHEGVPIGKFLSCFHGCPLVFDFQGSTVDEMVRGGLISSGGSFHGLMCCIEHMINKMPSVLISSSPILSEITTEDFGVDKHRVFTVLDAVDTSILKPMSKKEQNIQMLKRKFGIPDGNRVVIYVGSFSKLQGVDILIRSIPHVLRSIPNVTFLLIGGKWNIKYHELMTKLAQELNVKRHIMFIPSADYFRELQYYLNLADVAVAPKLHSPQSHGKLAVYMAAGLPTVAFDIRVNRIFLGRFGIFTREISPESLADGILFAIEQYTDDREFKRQLRRRACRLFSLKRLAKDLERVYNAVTTACQN